CARLFCSGIYCDAVTHSFDYW
nr:immunoglobulin heavy chain junction region [Macaca mulatta]MOX66983.1 immunoglobulin heavy chain junction region [Macaca mulatta]MOX68930.1 immunoglobulin heavy chain junction region [Macaca mulatta]